MDDLISRQAAIDALRKMQTYKLFSGDDMLLIDQAGAQTELMLLPPAQPERKKGRWIRNDNGTYSCSVCQSWIPEQQHCYARYCLYCEADMREVTE